MEHEKEERMLTVPNDDAIMKQVEATHGPLGTELAVGPIISITEQILIQAIGHCNGYVSGKGVGQETSREAVLLDELDMHDLLIIQKLSRELSSCKCSGGGAEAKTMELLTILSSYPWHAKVVLILSGFAINFGEFWYFAKPCSTNTLAKSLAQLRKLPQIGNKSSSLKRQFDNLNYLVKAALDVTKCISQVMNLPFCYISEDGQSRPEASALFLDAVYWTIISIVTCSSQIASFTSLRNEYILRSKETRELLTLASKVNRIPEQLKKHMDMSYQRIEQKIIQQCLRYTIEDVQKEVNMGILQRTKHVLLLISDLSISEEKIHVLANLYNYQPMWSERLYEIMWVPVVDKRTWYQLDQPRFRNVKSMMPWYSFHNPIFSPTITNKIKEKWNFEGEPIVVVQDPQGKVWSINAIHMMLIWGNLAYPFTREREEELWNSQTWSLETIVDPLDAAIMEWVRESEGRHICLYGGGNLEWIRAFTNTMTLVACAANITVKMVYVGKSNARNEIQNIVKIIAEENFMSHFLTDYRSIWFFWERLKSMLYSKSQHDKTVGSEKITSELTALLNYDGDNEEWAIFCDGANEMVRDNGIKILRALNGFEKWKADVEPKGFEHALKEWVNRRAGLRIRIGRRYEDII